MLVPLDKIWGEKLIVPLIPFTGRIDKLLHGPDVLLSVSWNV